MPRGRFQPEPVRRDDRRSDHQEQNFLFRRCPGFHQPKSDHRQLSTVPTPLMKQGNFTELRNTLPAPTVPSQAGCIQGNIIAASCIDPVASKLLALFPDPTFRPPWPAGQARQLDRRSELPVPVFGAQRHVLLRRPHRSQPDGEQPPLRPLQRIITWIGRIRRGRAIPSPAMAISRRNIASAVNRRARLGRPCEAVRR